MKEEKWELHHRCRGVGRATCNMTQLFFYLRSYSDFSSKNVNKSLADRSSQPLISQTLGCIFLQESLGRLKGRGKSIVADWVDRSLYWLEEQNNAAQNAIMKYDLNRRPDTPDVILVRPTLILGVIQVSPQQR